MVLQIREGAYYRRRDGSIVGPAKLEPYPIQGTYPWYLGDYSYTNQGCFSISETSELDLINEVQCIDIPLDVMHANLHKFLQP